MLSQWTMGVILLLLSLESPIFLIMTSFIDNTGKIRYWSLALKLISAEMCQIIPKLKEFGK